MKTFLTIALCVLLTSVVQGAGDADTIFGGWVGNNYESLFIMDSVAFFETGIDRHIFNYTLRGDSLELFSPMLEEPDEDGGLCFIIKHHDPDSLVLRPYRGSTRKQYKLAREYGYLFDSTSTITLQSILSLRDTLLSFDRLLFCTHFKSPFVGGPRLKVDGKGEMNFPHNEHIEVDKRIIIDSTKTMYLYGNKFAMQILSFYKCGNQNALKQGYYQGCLSDSLYNELIFLLSISNLERMNFKGGYHGVPELLYSLDIYYNNKYKRTIGVDPPLIGDDLFIYLSSIYRDVPLVKSKTAKKMFEQFYKTQDK